MDNELFFAVINQLRQQLITLCIFVSLFGIGVIIKVIVHNYSFVSAGLEIFFLTPRTNGENYLMKVPANHMRVGLIQLESMPGDGIEMAGFFAFRVYDIVVTLETKELLTTHIINRIELHGISYTAISSMDFAVKNLSSHSQIAASAA